MFIPALMLRVCFPVRVNGVMNSEVCLHLVKERSGILLPGEVSERHFWLLIEISGMHSEKVINALREHLVMGYTRREACEQHGVSQGYLSGALVRIQHLSQTVNNLLPYYVSGLAMNHEEEGDRSVKRGGDWRV